MYYYLLLLNIAKPFYAIAISVWEVDLGKLREGEPIFRNTQMVKREKKWKGTISICYFGINF
jgi:hypothetical protein